jgi:hypothetical protein
MERSSVDALVDELARELDATLIDASLRLTPTERLEAMRRILELADEAERSRGTRSESRD